MKKNKTKRLKMKSFSKMILKMMKNDLQSGGLSDGASMEQWDTITTYFGIQKILKNNGVIKIKSLV